MVMVNIPMTDPYVWYPNANMTGVLIDGKWQTINMALTYGSVMGNRKLEYMTPKWGFPSVWVPRC